MLVRNQRRARPPLSFEEQKVGFPWSFDGAKQRSSLVKADQMVEGSFDEAVDSVDGVFHTASPVFKSCAKSSSAKPVVLTSSCAVIRYGSTSLSPLHESHSSDLDYCKKYIAQPQPTEFPEQDANLLNHCEEEPPCKWPEFGSLDLPMEFPDQETLLNYLLDHWEQEAVLQPTVPMATELATNSSQHEESHWSYIDYWKKYNLTEFPQLDTNLLNHCEEEPPCKCPEFGSLDLPMEFPDQETLLNYLLDHREQEAVLQPTVPMATESATNSSQHEESHWSNIDYWKKYNPTEFLEQETLLSLPAARPFFSSGITKEDDQPWKILSTCDVEECPSFDKVLNEGPIKKRKQGSKRQRWTLEEHRLFLKLVKDIGWGKWKLIAAEMKTKTAAQVTSHAQKYLNRRKGGIQRKSINDITIDDHYVVPLSTCVTGQVSYFPVSMVPSLGANTLYDNTYHMPMHNQAAPYLY